MDLSGSRRISHAATFAANVSGERCFLHAAVNSCFFERFERSGLGVGQSRFGFAFGESPVTAVGSNQEEFNFSATNAIANRRHLFALPQPPQMRQPKTFDWRQILAAQYD